MEESETLARYLGNEDVPTKKIESAKQFAYRRYGKRMGKHLINALQRLERKKLEAKK
ncbi:MAG TPA: hypothetical protein VI895_00565 [Bdellovibrionota bacterium]|nr:hypothetical protein [Bdellovibrionota bacterium]